MKNFDTLPKSIKKTLRYINQDVQSIEKLEQIKKTMDYYINKRKQQLEKGASLVKPQTTVIKSSI